MTVMTRFEQDIEEMRRWFDSPRFRGIRRLYTPREFAELKVEALKMGFRHVESGPLVRSSYHAHEQATSTGLVSAQ